VSGHAFLDAALPQLLEEGTKLVPAVDVEVDADVDAGPRARPTVRDHREAAHNPERYLGLAEGGHDLEERVDGTRGFRRGSTL
jgi:hypothetical protein